MSSMESNPAFIPSNVVVVIGYVIGEGCSLCFQRAWVSNLKIKIAVYLRQSKLGFAQGRCLTIPWRVPGKVKSVPFGIFSFKDGYYQSLVVVIEASEGSMQRWSATSPMWAKVWPRSWAKGY